MLGPGNYSRTSETTYWIVKNSFFLVKMESIDIQESDGVRVFDWPLYNCSITTTEMDITFYDYNVPVTIELPPEAENS